MSQENINVVRDGFERFWADEEVWHLFDDDIIWRTRSDMPDTDTYRGVEAVKALIDSWVKSFERMEVDVLDAVDIDDRVIVSLYWRAWLTDSEDPIGLPEAQVWRLREGKALEVHEYPSWEEALEAAGLPE